MSAYKREELKQRFYWNEADNFHEKFFEINVFVLIHIVVPHGYGYERGLLTLRQLLQ